MWTVNHLNFFDLFCCALQKAARAKDHSMLNYISNISAAQWMESGASVPVPTSFTRQTLEEAPGMIEMIDSESVGKWRERARTRKFETIAYELELSMTVEEEEELAEEEGSGSSPSRNLRASQIEFK